MAEAASTQQGDAKQVRGTQVPKASLQQAEQLALELWNLARKGEAAREALAKKLGASATSSAFKKKIALLGYYGLASYKAGKLKLTTLGLDLVQTVDAKRQQEARRRAVLTDGHFAKILHDSDGEELPSEEALSSIFHFEHSLNEKSAQQAARALIDSIHHAGLIDDEGRVHLTRHEHAAAEDSDEEGDSAEVEREEPDSKNPRFSPSFDINTHGTRVAVNVTVNLTLDGTNFSEIERLLSLLGATVEKHES